MSLLLPTVSSIELNQSICFTMTDQAYIGAARRSAVSLASHLNFPEKIIEHLKIIISELGSNLLKHAAKGGQLLITPTLSNSRATLEILAIDKGPGIDNLNLCLKDGYSTTHTSGTGLGAICRLAEEFNIYSLPKNGTIIQASVSNQPRRVDFIPSEIGSICVAKQGEEICGDRWASYQSASRCLIVILDGLGHGPEAANAAKTGCKIFEDNQHLGPIELVALLNKGLYKTRGAATSVVEIDKINRLIKFAGLGNVIGSIIKDKKTRYMVSQDGTAGIDTNRIREFTYSWEPETLVVMHSDGLISRWSLDKYPGLSRKHPSLIAGVLFRDFCRGYDDTTIVAVR